MLTVQLFEWPFFLSLPLIVQNLHGRPRAAHSDCSAQEKPFDWPLSPLHLMCYTIERLRFDIVIAFSSHPPIMALVNFIKDFCCAHLAGCYTAWLSTVALQLVRSLANWRMLSSWAHFALTNLMSASKLDVAKWSQTSGPNIMVNTRMS